MEEQLPSSERAGQGEKYEQQVHLNDTFTLLFNRGSTKNEGWREKSGSMFGKQRICVKIYSCTSIKFSKDLIVTIQMFILFFFAE